MSENSPLLVAAVAAALSLVAVLAGCGEKPEEGSGGAPQRVELMLDFYVNPDHAGIYEALERGYFEEAGLDVQPREPSDPSAPIKQVAAGNVDLAISYEPEVMLARDEGLDVVAVAALVDRPLTSLISVGSENIRSVDDLAGKRVATAGIPYQTVFLEAILREAGLTPDDVDQVDVGLSLLPAVLSGKADAMLGGFLNVEGVDLDLRGEDPRIEPVDELGIPTYDELVLVASGETARDDPETIRLFLAALERGTEDATRDPEAATETILAANRDLDPGLTAAEIEATLPLLLPRGDDTPFGYMDPQEWEEFAGFLADEGLIEELPDVSELQTNDLLPGEIPK